MRVALIKPSWEYPITSKEHTYNRCWPPLELLNCGAILEAQGHEVELIDAHVERLSPDGVLERIGHPDIAIVTSSALDRWQCPNLEIEPVVALCKTLRDRCPKLYLTGFHGTNKPAAMLRETGVDAVLIGEPEETVREIGAGADIASVPGIGYLENDALVRTAPATPLDMEALPVPAFHLADLKRYYYEILGPKFMVLEGVRGCPYPCTFCSRTIQGKPLRRKTVEQLGKEVEVAVRDFGVKNIYFIDLEFTASPELAKGISQYIIDKGIKVSWCCQTRTDWIDEPLLRLMKKAGCKLIHYGVETGSERIAELVRKKVTVAQQREGLLLTKRMGIETLCFFLMGYPSETEEEMLETLRFAKELNPTYASFHRISPYQGTPLYEGLNGEKGDLFPAFAGTDEEKEKVDTMVRKAVREYYLRPRYIASRLFKANPRALWQQLQLFAGYLR